ncbi:MAG TPA: histidinol dehydrogenase, partial [Acetobacteraceae bacterium]|nr:histidinol dehydrogenase [Acetobacteraceae bacterium]
MKFLSSAATDFSEAFAALVAQARDTTTRVDGVVADILKRVHEDGDAALCDYTARFDGLHITPDRLRIDEAEITEAVSQVTPDLLAALDLAATRIEIFHRAQAPVDLQMHDDEGVTMGMRWTP